MNGHRRNIARVIYLIPVFLAVGAVAAVTGISSSSQTETLGPEFTADSATPSVGDQYPTTGIHQPSVGNSIPTTGNHQPSAGDSFPSTGNHQPSTGNKGPGGSTGCEDVHIPTNHCGGIEENPKEDDVPDQASDLPSMSTASGQTSAPAPAGGVDRKKRRSIKRSADSKKLSAEDDKTPPAGAGETGAADSALESSGLGSKGPLLVLTSPKLNNLEVHRISGKALLRRMVIGYKGYIEGAADPESLKVSLLRREGDRCYLPYPAGRLADCDAFNGHGRLHLLRSSGRLRFAYRPLASAEGSHSARVKRAIQHLRSDGGMPKGRYVLRFKFRSTGGSSHVYKYLFAAG